MTRENRKEKAEDAREREQQVAAPDNCGCIIVDSCGCYVDPCCAVINEIECYETTCGCLNFR